MTTVQLTPKAVQYAWKHGSRVRAKAQEAGERLEQIRERDGGLEPGSVLDDARSPVSVFHGDFEWDDAIAAEEHRIDRARYIIRSAVVVREEPSETAFVRAFVVVTEDDTQHYQSIAVALSDQGMRRQVVERALRELEAWERRHAEIEELAEVFAVADKLRGKSKREAA